MGRKEMGRLTKADTVAEMAVLCLVASLALTAVDALHTDDAVTPLEDMVVSLVQETPLVGSKVGKSSHVIDEGFEMPAKLPKLPAGAPVQHTAAPVAPAAPAAVVPAAHEHKAAAPVSENPVGLSSTSMPKAPKTITKADLDAQKAAIKAEADVMAKGAEADVKSVKPLAASKAAPAAAPAVAAPAAATPAAPAKTSNFQIPTAWV